MLPGEIADGLLSVRVHVHGPVNLARLLPRIVHEDFNHPPAVFVAILWSVVAYRVRAAFAGLFHDAGEERLSPRHSAEGRTQLA